MLDPQMMSLAPLHTGMSASVKWKETGNKFALLLQLSDWAHEFDQADIFQIQMTWSILCTSQYSKVEITCSLESQLVTPKQIY